MKDSLALVPGHILDLNLIIVSAHGRLHDSAQETELGVGTVVAGGKFCKTGVKHESKIRAPVDRHSGRDPLARLAPRARVGLACYRDEL